MTEHHKLLKTILVWIFLIHLSPATAVVPANGFSSQEPITREFTGDDDPSTKSYVELAALEH
jgi:hypothetical protein